MKQAKAIAYLRQLCCLGLGKDVIIPEFLEAVKDVIPSGNNLTTQLDENFVPIAAIINYITPEVIQLARSLILTVHTPENTQDLLEVFQRDGFVTEAFFGCRKVFDGDFYNLVWIPCEQHYLIQVPIYVNQRPVELLWLYRSRFEKPFTSKEQQLALQLAPYIAHALQQRPDNDVEYVYNGDSSLIVADCQGHIIYLSHTAQRMLTMATQLERYKQGLSYPLCLPPALVNICQNLEGIFQGEAAQPPMFSHSNAYGKFVFRAYWLDKCNREPGGLIGISIEHHEPQMLAVIRALKFAGLSANQNQVALLLCQGMRNEEIGREMHIKQSTVIDHIRKIFIKLDIHKREELLPKLLRVAQENQGHESTFGNIH